MVKSPQERLKELVPWMVEELEVGRPTHIYDLMGKYAVTCRDIDPTALACRLREYSNMEVVHNNSDSPYHFTVTKKR